MSWGCMVQGAMVRIPLLPVERYLQIGCLLTTNPTRHLVFGIRRKSCPPWMIQACRQVPLALP